MTRSKSIIPLARSQAFLWEIVVSGAVFGILLVSGFGSGIWGLTEIAPRFASPALDDALWTLLGTFVTVGVPVMLYLRMRLIAPGVILIVEFALWTLIMTGAVWFFAVFLWPLYLVLFLVGGGIEYLLRNA